MILFSAVLLLLLPPHERTYQTVTDPPNSARSSNCDEQEREREEVDVVDRKTTINEN